MVHRIGRHVDRDIAEQPDPERGAVRTQPVPTHARTGPGRRPRRDPQSAPSRRSRTPHVHGTIEISAAVTGTPGDSSSPGQAANAERDLYGERRRSGGPSGSTCHHDWPAEASQSANLYASGPSRPPGSELRCSCTPLDRVRSIIGPVQVNHRFDAGQSSVRRGSIIAQLVYRTRTGGYFALENAYARDTHGAGQIGEQHWRIGARTIHSANPDRDPTPRAGGR